MMNFTSKFDIQVLTVAFLGIDLEERMKYKIGMGIIHQIVGSNILEYK